MLQRTSIAFGTGLFAFTAQASGALNRAENYSRCAAVLSVASASVDAMAPTQVTAKDKTKQEDQYKQKARSFEIKAAKLSSPQAAADTMNGYLHTYIATIQHDRNFNSVPPLVPPCMKLSDQ